MNVKSLDETNKVDIRNEKLYDNGLHSTSFDIDPLNGLLQKVTVDAACTMSILTSSEAFNLYLHVYEGDTGGSLSLPTGEWVGGTVVDNTVTPSAHDLLKIHYDGTSFVYEYLLNLS